MRLMRRLRPVESFEVIPLSPYNFELTIHKPLGYHWINPTEIYHDGTIWTVMELVSGEPVGLRLKNVGTINSPRISGTIFSDEKLGGSEERMLLNDVKRCLELNIDIGGFYSMAEHDPIIKQVKADLYGMRCGQHQLLFHNIVRAITM